MIEFDFCRFLGILKGQIEDNKYFLGWGSNLTSESKKPGQSAVVIHYCGSSRFFWLRRYGRAEIEKYFVRFLVQMKTVEFAFGIIKPLNATQNSDKK